MSEMVERIAKAIYAVNAGAWRASSWEEAGGDVPHSSTREAYFREARAAIEAMRNPTSEMIEGPAKRHMDSYSSNLAWWDKMISSALGKVDA